MELRGKVSNIKAFMGKGGKQFFKADFEASNRKLELRQCFACNGRAPATGV